LQDDLHATVSIPTLDQVRQQAAINNPDLRAALEAVREAGDDVTAARAAYLPPLTLDYFYGIDATHFAVNSVVDGQKFSNLGSWIEGTLNIPVWNRGTTQSRVKQSELRRTQAKRELSLAQRKVLADVQSLHSEADMALQELDGLRRSAELAADSLQLTTLRYKEGEAKVLDVVDAQTTFYSTNSAYQDGAVRYRVALAGLQTLTGVLTIP
jgi:outer membrane protein